MLKQVMAGVLACGAIGLISAESAMAAKGDVRVSGFARAGGSAVLGDAPNYMSRIDKDGDAGDTHFGLNITADIGDGWQAAGQLWGSGVESAERYNMALDWAYITKRMGNLSLSAGKIKYPNLLVSEYVDVGITYPWVRPPEELYAFETDGVNLSLESFEGATAIYNIGLNNMDVSLQAFGGQAGVEDGLLERMMGAKVQISTDNINFVIGHNTHFLRLNPAGERGALNGETANVTNFGVSVDIADVVAYAEYAMGSAGEDSEISAYYATLGYRVGKMLPHFTYADVENGEGWGQTSMAFGVKYQATPSASLKLELKNIEGKQATGGEMSGFFAGETDGSVNVIGAAIDVVF